MPGTARNLTDHLAYREGVSLYLRISGIDDAAPRPTLRKLSEQIGAVPHPDVLVPGQWSLETSARISYRLTEDLESAQTVADAAGLPRAAVVQRRSGRPLGDSLVVMTLEEFAGLIAPPG